MSHLRNLPAAELSGDRRGELAPIAAERKAGAA